MSQFRDAYDEFRRQHVEVAAISVDSPHSHRAWAAELQIPYPLLSDFGREFMTAYRIPPRDLRLLPRVSSRSAFLVDAEGIIRYAWYTPGGGELPSVDEILQATRRLPTPTVSAGDD